MSKRFKRHLVLFLFSVILTAVFFYILPSKNPVFKTSMATAYGGLFLVSLTLVIGPWNIIFGRPNPVSSYLRRDIGIWAGILAIVHTIVGLQVHMGGKFWLYFIPDPKGSHLLPIRLDVFGFTNHSGLVAILIFILLLSLSNNYSLKKLGALRWKKFQKWNYAIAGLVLFHGIIYQVLEKRSLGYSVIFAIPFLLILFFQIWGYRVQLKKRSVR